MDAGMMAMMQQMMQDPTMMQQVAAMAGPFEAPALSELLDPLREQKQIGTEKFKARDLEGALRAYQAAIAAAGGTDGALAWPQAEDIVFVCRANAALCWLQLGRPAVAITQCDAALAMPCAQGSEVLHKVLARKLQGLIEAAKPEHEIFGFSDQLRLRGCFYGVCCGLSRWSCQVHRAGRSARHERHRERRRACFHGAHRAVGPDKSQPGCARCGGRPSRCCRGWCCAGSCDSGRARSAGNARRSKAKCNPRSAHRQLPRRRDQAPHAQLQQRRRSGKARWIRS